MTSPKAKQIVVAFDFSATAQHALERALDTAQGNVLHVVCVLEPGGQNDYQYADRLQAALADRIARDLDARATKEAVHFFVHVRIGKPADEILMLAQEIGADAIMIGTKGLTGVERIMLGSVAERVVREAGCSVEVVRAKTYGWTPLLDMTKVERHPTYVPPHRYSYEDKRVEKRPIDWPLY